jgi:hypothetical protein
MFTFVAAKQGYRSGQAPLNCFTKNDPFRGQNGWTGTWLMVPMVYCMHFT